LESAANNEKGEQNREHTANHTAKRGPAHSHTPLITMLMTVLGNVPSYRVARQWDLC